MIKLVQTLTNVLQNSWDTLCDMSPYLLFGFAIAGALSIFVSPKFVEAHLGQKGFLSILKASALGVPLPLCSCGVIPVAASLRKHGASRGATTAFLLSTPQTGADSIMVTYSLLGPLFAVFRPLAALVTGLVGGSLVDVVEKHNGQDSTESCQDDCCNNREADGRADRWRKAFRHGFVVLPRDIGRAMLAGILIAGAIGALVPNGAVPPALGSGIGAMLIMMLFGIPVYVCATASIPIAAALILKGVSPGAVLVFLMTGPATNAATIATIWKTMGTRTAVTYLATVGGMAITCGLLLDSIFTITGASAEHVGHHGLPAWGGPLSAIVLLTVMVNAARPRRPAASQGRADSEHASCCGHDGPSDKP